MQDLLEQASKFLDEEGILNSSLKRNVPISVEKLKPLLFGIHSCLWGFQYEVCGSIRRGSSTVRDIDLVVSLRSGGNKSEDMEYVYSRFKEMDIEVVTKNHSGACLVAKMSDDEFIRVDVLFCEPYNLGVATLFMTGSKDWNDLIRLRCQRLHMQFKPSGILKEESTHCFRTESEALKFMNIAWVDPKDRMTGTKMLDLDGNLIGVVF
jgi:DNA polymerase/3'-5' exonuclease PolX